MKKVELKNGLVAITDVDGGKIVGVTLGRKNKKVVWDKNGIALNRDEGYNINAVLHGNDEEGSTSNSKKEEGGNAYNFVFLVDSVDGSELTIVFKNKEDAIEVARLLSKKALNLKQITAGRGILKKSAEKKLIDPDSAVSVKAEEGDDEIEFLKGLISRIVGKKEE